MKKNTTIIVASLTLACAGIITGTLFSQEAEGPKYVGSETCEMCHDTYKADVDKGKHGFVYENKDTPDVFACEACHGPGEAHSAGAQEGDAEKMKQIINPAKAKVADSSAQCMKCHKVMFEEEDWNNSSHVLNGVGCTTCHKIHNYDPKKDPIKEGYKSCIKECHKDNPKEYGNSKAKFGHKIPKVANCLTCHSPHSRITTATTRENCVKCHADKGGPFKFNHGNGWIEDCTACHMPHVGTEKGMLKMEETIEFQDPEGEKNEKNSKDDKKKKEKEKKEKKEKDKKKKKGDEPSRREFCMQCHSEHSTESCAACHNEKIHVEVCAGGCIRCHPEHGFGTNCTQCHKNPHPNGVRPPNCSKCHETHEGKDCMDCHTQIHGSADSRRMLKPDLKTKPPSDDKTPKPQRPVKTK